MNFVAGCCPSYVSLSCSICSSTVSGMNCLLSVCIFCIFLPTVSHRWYAKSSEHVRALSALFPHVCSIVWLYLYSADQPQSAIAISLVAGAVSLPGMSAIPYALHGVTSAVLELDRPQDRLYQLPHPMPGWHAWQSHDTDRRLYYFPHDAAMPIAWHTLVYT